MDIKYAGFSKRLFAHNIDLSILMLSFVPVYILIDEQRLFFLVALLVSVSYFTLMESSKMQATLGKKIANLSVISDEGQRLTFIRSFIRTVVKFISILILFIGIVLVYVRKDKKGLHDLIARTLVKENT